MQRASPFLKTPASFLPRLEAAPLVLNHSHCLSIMSKEVFLRDVYFIPRGKRACAGMWLADKRRGRARGDCAALG